MKIYIEHEGGGNVTEIAETTGLIQFIRKVKNAETVTRFCSSQHYSSSKVNLVKRSSKNWEINTNLNKERERDRQKKKKLTSENKTSM